MKRIILFLFIVISSIGSVYADDVRKVKGEFTFYGDGSHSRDYCKNAALEGARIQALAKEFGTVLSQNVTQDDKIDARGESTFFSSMTSTEVKGEWIADTEEPVFTYDHDSEGNLIVTCKVKGTAKPISNEAVDFEAIVLRNGSERKFADTTFRTKDSLRLLFRAPRDGFMAVYLIGSDKMAYRLLPYLRSADGRTEVKHDREYIFFDPEHSEPGFGQVDDLSLETDMPVEQNQIYVIYSPNEFTKAVDDYNGELAPRSLTYDKFSKWLNNARKRDNKMSHKVINVFIKSDV